MVNSRDPDALKALAGQFDLIINTVNVDLDWQPYFEALAYGGNFHTVGAVLKPLPVPAFHLNCRGSQHLRFGDRDAVRAAQADEVCRAQQGVATTELYPMSQINEAIQHVRDGKARYRVVLKADF